MSEPLFCFSYASSLQEIYIFAHKAQFVFVLYPSTSSLTEFWMKLFNNDDDNNNDNNDMEWQL